MRIGLVIPSLHGGGAEFVARQWMGNSDDSEHQWSVFTSRPGPRAAENISHEVYDVATKGPGRHLRYINWLTARLRQHEIDVALSMITYCNLALLMAVARLPKSGRPPVVISERNIPSKYLPLEGLSGSLQIYMAKALYRRADGVIAVSHPVAADLLSYGIDARRLHVVRNPVLNELPAFSARVGDGTLRILFVGRLVEQKRPQLILDVSGVGNFRR
jgi:glycosyltransferase involved in cell wall biosynthesis